MTSKTATPTARASAALVWPGARPARCWEGSRSRGGRRIQFEKAALSGLTRRHTETPLQAQHAASSATGARLGCSGSQRRGGVVSCQQRRPPRHATAKGACADDAAQHLTPRQLARRAVLTLRARGAQRRGLERRVRAARERGKSSGYKGKMYSEFRLYIRYCAETHERPKLIYPWNCPERPAARGQRRRPRGVPPRHREGLTCPLTAPSAFHIGAAAWGKRRPPASERGGGCR